jgi:hypothetical protein
VVQVSGVSQLSMFEHGTQESAVPGGPCWRNNPLAHCVHFESAALLHVTSPVQPATGRHSTQESDRGPLWTKRPLVHWPQREEVALVQISGSTQKGMAVHSTQESERPSSRK